MQRFGFLVFVTALALGGCTALEQFPEKSDDYSADLDRLDPSYSAALADLNESGISAEEQKRIRNEEIDRRVAVIDANFKNFQIELAQENVTADFGISLVEVGVGGAGALVTETASQILSAVSGGLAGAQAAYGKAALYEKALSALLAQMIASRKTVLVRILDGRTRSYDEYPLSAAVHDLDAYYFAGSLPGAIVATSADAQVKNKEAEDNLASFRVTEFQEDDDAAQKISAFLWPPDGDPAQPVDQANLQKLRDWIELSPVKGLPIQNFLSDARLKDLRVQAVNDLGIP